MSESADQNEASSHKKPRLLIAEDEPSLRLLLGEMLVPEYELFSAPDGERAWEMLQSRPFDLILMDVRMPGVDGIELTRRLRAQAHTATVPVLLLSGCNRISTLVEGLEAGADDFLLKPFRPQELLARVRSKWRLSEMRRQAA